MRHALEHDHLAAVSTLVMDERTSRKAARLGACWGVDRTRTLMITSISYGHLAEVTRARAKHTIQGHRNGFAASCPNVNDWSPERDIGEGQPASLS
jgi:hypothetical protein